MWSKRTTVVEWWNASMSDTCFKVPLFCVAYFVWEDLFHNDWAAAYSIFNLFKHSIPIGSCDKRDILGVGRLSHCV